MAYNPRNESIEDYKKRRREEYGELFDKVSTILFEHDPVELDYETNIDEYEPEARRIMPLIKQADDVNHLATLLRNVFVQMFEGDDIDRKEGVYLQIAAKIWELRDVA
jgi:hypothetical protein